jgi:hypothetical protein
MDKHMEEMRKWNALPEGQQETETRVSAAKNKRNWNRIRTGLYTAIAVMLVMSAAMGSAWAYFTSFSSAKGSVALKLGHEEHIDEEFSDWQKVLDIQSTEDSNPVYLRMRAYSADYPVTYDNNDNWTKVGDWMYYNKDLKPGKKLSESGDALLVQINNVPKSGDAGLEDGKTFNVIVVYESTEVQYDEQGNMIPATEADWSKKVDTNRRSSTLGGE